MAPSSSFAPVGFRSLLLGALGLAIAGCGSSDRPEQGASSPPAPRASSDQPESIPQTLSPATGAETVAPEPTLSGGEAVAAASIPAEAGPSVAQTELLPGVAASQEDAPPERLLETGPVESETEIVGPPSEWLPAPAEAPPSAAASQEPSPPMAAAVAPRFGSNPLRNGIERSPGLRSPQVAPASIAKTGSGGGDEDDVPFDPIKENGEIFEDWAAPKLALLITGRQDGYLEPCGCAGLDRMKGGLSRRHSMLDELRNQRGWPVLALDVGGLVKGFGPQADLKFQMTLNAMQAMRYEVIALGKTELQFSIGDLLFAGTGQESPFISANAALLAFDAGLTESWRVAEAGGMKLGITSIVGSKWQKEIHNDDMVLADPEEKLAKVVPALEKECDMLVLLAHATREESIGLAERFAQFDVVVTAGGRPEPPDEPEHVAGGKTALIEVGEKGMNAVVLGLYDDSSKPIRYQRVPLDSRFPQSDYLRKLMEQYQEGLKELGLEGLGVSAVPYPGRELLGGFVGSKECKSCHEESYKVWRKSGHAKAWQTLLEKDPPRNFDPECISCHVVGWSPQNYRPFVSGFLSEKETPHLVGVGCEICHGPGERHVKAEMGADFDLQEKLRKASVITLEQSQQAVSRAISDKQPCMNCHDLDNSPAFDFEEYWAKIEHREE